MRNSNLSLVFPFTLPAPPSLTKLVKLKKNTIVKGLNVIGFPFGIYLIKATKKAILSIRLFLLFPLFQPMWILHHKSFYIRVKVERNETFLQHYSEHLLQRFPSDGINKMLVWKVSLLFLIPFKPTDRRQLLSFYPNNENCFPTELPILLIRTSGFGWVMVSYIK